MWKHIKICKKWIKRLKAICQDLKIKKSSKNIFLLLSYGLKTTCFYSILGLPLSCREFPDKICSPRYYILQYLRIISVNRGECNSYLFAVLTLQPGWLESEKLTLIDNSEKQSIYSYLLAVWTAPTWTDILIKLVTLWGLWPRLPRGLQNVCVCVCGAEGGGGYGHPDQLYHPIGHLDQL